MNWLKRVAKTRKNVDKKRVYLDYAAATPMLPEVQKIITETYNFFANPSAIHKEGVEARRLLEAARLKLGRLLKVRPEGVVFTGNGTESNNLAIYGLLRKLRESGKEFSDMAVISTQLEHPSITKVLEHLEELGVEVRYVKVEESGLVSISSFNDLLDEKVVLVTLAYVNSEIGVVQPVSKLARTVKKFNQVSDTNIKVHTDAAQAPLWLPCQFDVLGVDMLSLDAGKCNGPKGVGVLALRHGVQLSGVLLGGGQEFGLRSGTENLPQILGSVEAIVLAQEGREERSAAVATLRDELIKALQAIDGVVVNGSLENRVANNVNVSISGVDGEFAVISMDEAGFAISTKSACSGAGGGGSKVVETISGDAARAATTLRITLGPENTKADITHFVAALSTHVDQVREAHARLISS